jgi:hypothetical protein
MQEGVFLYVPDLPNQLLAVACAASVTTRAETSEDLMMLLLCGRVNVCLAIGR